MKNTLHLTGGECHPARTMLSLVPLINFWKTTWFPGVPTWPGFADIMAQLPEALQGDISDKSV